MLLVLQLFRKTTACFESRKDLLSLDRLLSRLDTMSVMLLIILFGWLDILLIYRDVVDYALWVVGNFVDIQGCVVRLFVGSVRFVTYIERDVQ